MRAWLLAGLVAGAANISVVRAQMAPFARKDVLILSSTKNYQLAVRTARQAATRLRLSLNLEAYRPNPRSGLTLGPKECAENGLKYPAYIPRGCGMVADSGFVSVEYSNGYAGFAKGYYLVVAAVGESGSPLVRQVMRIARSWYPEAHAQTAEMYVGALR